MSSVTAQLATEKSPSSNLTPSSGSLQNYPPSLIPPKNHQLEDRPHKPIADLERQEPRATSPPPIAATAAPSRSYHPLSWSVITLLALPSVLGVLARLGIHSLTTYDGDSVFALAWVQGMGCFVMGLAMGKRQTITDFYPPLYTAITTGFCGSLTTFSSWQLDVFQAWSNANGFHRGWLRDVMDGLTKTAITMLISLGALSFGLHISTHIQFRPPPIRPNSVAGKVVGLFSLLAYLATIPLYFRLSPRFRIGVTSALLFSFPGTLTRHLLGTYLNALRANLPIGTLGANSLGTGLLAAFHVVQRTPVSPTACAILQGLIDGYCGCLTTISTFAVEIRGLKGWNAWRYFGLSYIIGQVLMVAIVGGSWWSGRVKEHSMCSGPV
ncbi:unnamed protein product [Rhizoctonia solani]|uniref:CrcB domain protein n=1 Tax=Rhizoctonia solani AG-3 Rhs1AP TaxID=1086054 RepID=X8JGB8_9AGAM|nr:CrcB domain protein [Rhizoctonia solani AG-3 Rhs1AP]CAE6400948.1 unnamed protein product [Rhizoctonia solani]